MRTQFSAGDLRGRPLAALRTAVEQAIPVSAGGRNDQLTETAAVRVGELESDADVDPDARNGQWRLQLGTLGSGNHFIEVSLDELDRVWLFLHSGSRGVGNKIAQHHIGVAQKIMDRYWITLPNRDLAYLVEGTEEFWAYIQELRWAQK